MTVGYEKDGTHPCNQQLFLMVMVDKTFLKAYN
uniref:Uncharacterized protein n=1 Tax=Anguilla anguilla TaxID=7936 RepID=A0A0E9XQC7_ANGAN